MKNIILKSIELKDWKSRTLKIDFNKNKTIIRGRNGIGKSSIISAWRWLLTGMVDAAHPSNYELYDNTKKLTHETPKAIVSAVISIDDCEYKITRTAKAGFTRKRGSVEWEKSSSDKYELFIDDIEYTPKRFREWIDENICDANLLIYLLDGTFFITLCHNSKLTAQKILLDVVGDIKDEEYKKDYSEIKNSSGKVNIYDVKASAKLKQRDANKDLLHFEERMKYLIDVLNNCVIEEGLEDKQKEYIKELEEIDKEIENLYKTGEHSEVNELKHEKALIGFEMDDCMIDYKRTLRDFEEKIKTLTKTSKEIDDINKLKQKEYDSCKEELERKEKEYNEHIEIRNDLRKQVGEIKSMFFSDEICQYCGQPLPPDLLEEQKRLFNEQKEKQISSITKQGKLQNKIIESLSLEIEKLKDIVSKGVTLLEMETPAVVTAKRDLFLAEYPSYQCTEKYKELEERSNDIDKKIEDLLSFDVEVLKSKRLNVRQEINKITEALSKNKYAETIRRDIKDTEENQKKAADALAKSFMLLDLVKEYEEESADILSRKVNEKLNYCKIQMWDMLKNGEIVPDCLILDSNGVKYGTTNAAERIKINIDIQRLFMKSLGVCLPVFVDECSIFSSYNVPQIDGQGVFIYASDDNEIIVE